MSDKKEPRKFVTKLVAGTDDQYTIHTDRFGTMLCDDQLGQEFVKLEEYEAACLERDRYRAALEFYAQSPEPDVATIFSKSALEWGENVVTWAPLIDLGEKAREALSTPNPGVTDV